MTARPHAQASIYETTIEHAELEQALEEREKLKERAGEARKAFRELDEQAKALIRSLDVADAPVRVGRFVISERSVAGRTVHFEAEPTTRVQISLLKDAA